MSRLLANIVNLGVVVVVLATGYAAVAAVRFLWNPRTFTFPAAPFGVMMILGAVVSLLYLAAAWVVTGRSYGGHLLGLRVVGPNGRPLGVVGAFLRATLCIAAPIGLLWVVVSRENRSAQDVLLRTSVVYDWHRRPARRRRPIR